MFSKLFSISVSALPEKGLKDVSSLGMSPGSKMLPASYELKCPLIEAATVNIHIP